MVTSIERPGWHERTAGKATGIERLRVLEGNAAAEYFKALGLLLEDDGFLFLGRHQRPPTTPFEAVSSFRYPLLWNCLLTHVERQGLDP